MASNRISTATTSNTESEYFSLDGRHCSFISALSTVTASDSEEDLDEDILDEYYQDAFDDSDLIYNGFATSTQLQLDSLQSFLSSSHSEQVPFDIIQTFQHGKYGIVHIAERIRTGRELVKIRIASTSLHRTCESAELLRELRAHRRIEQSQEADAGGHFVAKLLGHFDDPYFAFNVLEHHAISLEHPDLAELLLLPTAAGSVFRPPLTRFDRSPLTTLRLVAAEVTLGLLFLHSLDLVHQDIKPENLLITGSGHILIGDLGASHVMLKEQVFPRVKLDMTSIIVFSPTYAAPELCHRQNGHVCYDERVDWWSFGVTLHKLATGNLPSVDLNMQQIGIDVPMSYSPLQEMLSSLLVVNVNKRLSGSDVKEHRFFHSLEDVWEDLTNLCYPPFQHVLASDSESSLGTDISSFRPTFDDDTHYTRPSQAVSTPNLPVSRHAGPQDDQSKSFIEPLPSSASYFQYRSPPSVPRWVSLSLDHDQVSSPQNDMPQNEFSFSEPLTKAILEAMEAKAKAIRRSEQRARRTSHVESIRRTWSRTVSRIQNLWE